MAPTETFDYIIIGSGSAGSVLARRLGEDRDTRILVLEAGGRDHSLYIHMPATFAWPLADDRFNWYYHSEPEPGMNGRRMYCPRGRVMGGSSSINGMCYVRGHALDYDGWAGNRMPEWSYAHCLPYFRKAETFDQGANDYHGGDGPLHVTTPTGWSPLFAAWAEAGQQAGYPYTADQNGFQQEGVGPMFMTVRRGRRCSTAQAYLRPAIREGNVELRLRSLTTRILFESTRAVGVEYLHRGRKRQVRAEREVLLCGGAINSPQVLQLSGIGRADELRALGIGVMVDLPGVGENLQDHLEIYVQHQCLQPVTLHGVTRPLRKLRIGIEWLLNGTGLGSTNHFEAGGFVRRNDKVRHPDLQYHFLPVAASYDGSSVEQGHGYQAHVGPMRPTSRGHVKAISADPTQPPGIVFNYMTTEQDRREMRDAVRITRSIFAQPAFDPFRGPELAPGPQVDTNDAIDAFVRERGESAYHPSGTCKMGLDEDAVVDDQARVHGLEGLRVIDASIMPRIVSGNLNAPTIMMAEKLADRVRGREPLAPSFAPVYSPPGR